MDEIKILALLGISRRYVTIRNLIHACNLEYDRESADEYENEAREIHAKGRAIRASMSDEEIQEYERRLRFERD